MLKIVPVVEGDGDAAALPPLLRRILAERLYEPGKIGRPVVAHGRNELEKKLDKFLNHAQRQHGCQGILVLVDADNDCPVEVATDLKAKAAATGVVIPVQIVYAHRKYESWFLASLETVRGHRGLPTTAILEALPEDIPNPKDWLSDQMPRGIAYKERADQPALSARIDIELAYANSPSFQQLCKAVERLIGKLEPLTH